MGLDRETRIYRPWECSESCVLFLWSSALELCTQQFTWRKSRAVFGKICSCNDDECRRTRTKCRLISWRVSTNRFWENLIGCCSPSLEICLFSILVRCVLEGPNRSRFGILTLVHVLECQYRKLTEYIRCGVVRKRLRPSGQWYQVIIYVDFLFYELWKGVWKKLLRQNMNSSLGVLACICRNRVNVSRKTVYIENESGRSRFQTK